jgi:hypothetical protein
VAEIVVKTETEQDHGWLFEVEVDDGAVRQHQVTLNWSDYDLWSRGRVAPEKVISAIFRFLLEREPAAAILERFDCALVRRYFSEVDRVLPELL